jgi:hypothetical protein
MRFQDSSGTFEPGVWTDVGAAERHSSRELPGLQWQVCRNLRIQFEQLEKKDSYSILLCSTLTTLFVFVPLLQHMND